MGVPGATIGFGARADAQVLAGALTPLPTPLRRVPAGTVEVAPDGSKFAVLGGGAGISIFDSATEEKVRDNTARAWPLLPALAAWEGCRSRRWMQCCAVCKMF